MTGGCSLPAKGPAKTWAARSRAAAVGKAVFSRPNPVIGARGRALGAECGTAGG